MSLPVVAFAVVLGGAAVVMLLRTAQLPALSSQTTDVLRQLKESIRIVQVATIPDDETDALFRAYKSANRDKVTYITVDPIRAPDAAKRYNVTTVPVTIVHSVVTGRMIPVALVDEKSLTTAIARAVAAQKVLYFTEGHQEKSVQSAGDQSYSMVSAALGKESYRISPVNLASASLPRDASVLVIAGPKTAFLPSETEQVTKYLDGGGSLLLLQDPAVPPVLEELLLRWDIAFADDMVIDVGGFGQQPSSPMITAYEPHPITAGFKTLTIFPLARSLRVRADSKGGVTSRPLLKTSDRTWGETRYPGSKDGSAQVTFDEGVDARGPVVLGVASSKDRAAVVVIGDSDFAADAAAGVEGNVELMLRIVRWLAHDTIDP